ncbi:GNAT family N-acetyltransferase [Erwinia sp. CPCC 100877]|nr:GNAT family N-acetyltransferase [Erwinia sp. CPCC 100877]
MYLKQATADQAPLAMQLLKETAEWLRDQGSSQWSDILSGDDKHGITNAVINGDVFFYYDEEEQLIGMAAAWRQASAWDQYLWESVETKNDVRYLHRVIVRPAFRGKNYGEKLLNALKEEFKGQVKELRLDCLGSNYKLISFYKRNNFKNIKSTKDKAGTKFELFSYLY